MAAAISAPRIQNAYTTSCIPSAISPRLCTLVEQYSGSFSLPPSTPKFNAGTRANTQGPGSGASWPDCSTEFVQYGYGLGTLAEVNCWLRAGAIGVYTTTYTNPSWRQYATVTSPAKGPMPSTSSSTSSSSSSSSSETLIRVVSSAPSNPTSSGKGVSMPIGAIAGIALGCLIVAVIGVVVIMTFRTRLRNLRRESGVPQVQTKQMDPQSPVPLYTPQLQQQYQAYPEQHQAHGTWGA
ncbi:hypothetical protein BDD12DRAFT_878152 [Trichophaea hybrida]|nr:hypothetical protein BDD12DRAFT_878152 [Trichophaea hybrida]